MPEAMPEAMVGYDEDLFLWSQQQAAALRDAARRGVNLPVDWEHVAEEIESLGRSDRRRVESRLERLVEHLLKLEVSTAVAPRSGWERTVVEQRTRLRRLLRDSPSIAGQVPDMLADAAPAAARLAALSLRAFDEETGDASLEVRARRYTPDDVLGDWIPSGPA